MTPQSTRLGIAVVAALLLSSCFPFTMAFPGPGAELPTVDGPEDFSLLSNTRGTLVWIDQLEDDQKLQVLAFPNLARSTIDLGREAQCVSGPDHQGRVVFLEPQGSSGYRLAVVDLRDGRIATFFEGQGEVQVGNGTFSLSPVGGLVALSVETHLGGSEFAPRELSVIDVADGTRRRIPGTIAFQRPWWFPDGRKLAISEPAPNPRFHITTLVDVETGARRRLHAGALLGVSTEGASVWIEEEGTVIRVDPDSGQVLDPKIELPGGRVGHGSWHQPVLLAGLANRSILYEGLPTTGTRQELVSGYMGPSAKYSVKLCDPPTQRFVTVLPYVWNPPISYGSCEL